MNSNLFSIDFDAIDKVLEEANQDLITKNDILINDSEKFHNEIKTNEDANSLKSFIQRLRIQIKETSKARLSDGRPFSEAEKRVKSWFNKSEDKLKKIDKTLSNSLASYARLKKAEIETLKKEEELNEETAIGVSYDGENIVKINNPVSNNSIKLPDPPKVKMVWKVDGFDRSTINLEMLRTHLSDYAIETAINNHIKTNWPEKISGVTYKEVLSSRL